MFFFLLATCLSTGKLTFFFVLVFVLGLIIGAQATSHEERALDYNLEDLELDELKKLEAVASAEGKAVIGKLKAAAARAKTLEQKIVQGIRSRV